MVWVVQLDQHAVCVVSSKLGAMGCRALFGMSSNPGEPSNNPQHGQPAIGLSQNPSSVKLRKTQVTSNRQILATLATSYKPTRKTQTNSSPNTSKSTSPSGHKKLTTNRHTLSFNHKTTFRCQWVYDYVHSAPVAVLTQPGAK